MRVEGSAAMRAGRQVSLLLLLQLRGGVSAPDLAAELGVSVRTIYRDVEQLSEAGVPIYAEAGNGGGIRLVDGYRTRLTGLDSAESEALVLAGWGAVADALGVGSAAAGAERKLFAALPRSAAASAQRIHARLHIDLARWYAPAETLAHLPALARAVWDQRRVRIDYSSWAQRSEREIEPLGLVLKNATWYLAARQGVGYRTYRVGEIVSLTVLEARFDPPGGFDLKAYWESSTRRFERSMSRETAIVRSTPAALPLLERIATGPVRKSKDGDPNVVTLPIESIERAVRDLLALGDAVEVLSPVELRNRIAAAASATARLYLSEAGRPPLSS
jgi:predicted DNA-binding transcriptional regulator YafY